MPKKHYKNTFAKPVSTAHHSLATCGPHNSRSSAASNGEQRSVNDLIDHLRRTQVASSSGDTPGPSRHVAPRSVHPSLRNLLELPETPPPRPRPDTRRAGIIGRRLRRTAGPPPPASWLAGNNASGDASDDGVDATSTATVIYRLGRLPGRDFPPQGSFLDTLLKSMALHWPWHVAYDGQFLGLLPTHVKILLLSYISYYARDLPLRGLMHGLRPVFETPQDPDHDGADQLSSDAEVTHLDLGGAIGRWMSLKQLSTELFVSKNPNIVQNSKNKPVPSSWEDEYNDGAEASPTGRGFPTSLQGLRFENLQFLSLAHPNPVSVNWNSLINLLSRLSTITHLSLAHWPVPTVTPNAVNTRIRHPTHRSLTFSYGGTDPYSAIENNWAEAAGILRKLSRVTYCLKWLDLEGCGDWIPAINWDGIGPDGEAYTTGPEWTGSWRDIEWIRLGPGWLPLIETDEFPTQESTETSPTSLPVPVPAPQSLAHSIYAPPGATGRRRRRRRCTLYERN
ncbi:hypothetical protein AOCH_003940 [Aspergillus ochraceoroseus]|uniref:Tafazzin n=1 Tax=Aspergillus ochraceoroseus TaxID=138278 RepID=A0A0F8U642_9EURO|nr:hypothetical protein AOCH_003940 [Aspergillus ochraceoroseus]